MYQMSDLNRIRTALVVLVAIFSVTYAASASSSSSTSRKSRGSTPNEIEQWPDLVVDLPSFGRQVVIDPKNASHNATRQSQPRKSNRRADPDINDIISGLVKLLGGQANVHVAEPERRKHDGEPSHSNSASSTRINNRGPPSLSDLPPGLPPGLISGNDEPIVKNQRVPPGQLRPPPGPPRGGPPQQNGFLFNNNRPRPVIRPQQQRPPPQQQQQPTSGKVRFPNDNVGPVVPPPFSSGVPIPEQLVPLQRPPGNLIPFPRPPTTTTTTSTTTTTETTTIELEPSEQEVTTVDTEPTPEQKFSLNSPSSSSTSTSSIQPTPPLATTSSTSSWTIVNEIKDDGEAQLRPGVVFDEESVGPGRPQEVVDVITAAGSVYPSAPGDVFDVTVSANQGFGGAGGGGSKRPVFVPVPDHHEDDIISSPIAKDGHQHDFVSIDGRKTYFNLLPTEVVDPSGTIRTENTAQTIGPPPPTSSPPPPAIREEVSPGVGIGTGFIRPLPPDEASEILANANNNNNGPGGIRRRPPAPPSVGASRPPGVRGGGDVVRGGQDEADSSTRRPFTRRPAAPPVRIDTCIVGDDTTCKAEENESCRTVFGVSSCYCRPGYARKRHREPCKTVSSLLISLKVDRMDSRKVSWHFALGDPDSEDYQRLEYEAEHALETILKKTPYKPFFIRSDINNFYPLGSRVIVNATVRLESNPMTTTTKVRHELRKHITAAIKQSPAASNANQPQQESSKLGDSLLAVDGLLNAIPQLGDFNECLDPKANDCDEHAECENTFGSFTCKCKPGYVEKDPNNKARAGRKCQTCSPSFCNNRGDCVVKNGAQVCQCRGSYFGERCEMDGEVVGVAVGASVAAVIIIVLTLVFLCLWSRKWKREQAKTDYAHTFTFVNPGLSGLAVLSQRLGMNGSAAGHGGAKTGPPPYRMNTMDGDRMHPGYHTDPSGGHGTLIPSLSQNVYAQPEPMMPKRSHTPNSLYATSNVAMPANAIYHQQKQQPQHHLHQQQQHGQSSKFMSLKKDSNGFGFGNRSTPLSFGESSEDDFEDSDVLTARVGGSNKGMMGGGGGGGAYNIPMIGSGLRPKSRSSHMAKSQNGHFYEADYSQYHGGDIYSSRGGTLTQPAIPMATYTQNIRPFYS